MEHYLELGYRPILEVYGTRDPRFGENKIELHEWHTVCIIGNPHLSHPLHKTPPLLAYARKNESNGFASTGSTKYRSTCRTRRYELETYLAFTTAVSFQRRGQGTRVYPRFGEALLASKSGILFA